MPINYRPSAFTSSAGGGEFGPMSGSRELSHAGLTTGVESQLAAPSDITSAHQFFYKTAPALAPGAESAAFASAHTTIGNASLAGATGNTISPLIQLIMKLPGIGAINSLFEGLMSLFSPDLFHTLDLNNLNTLVGHAADHVHDAVASLGQNISEHTPIDLSLLPADAPIFHGSVNNMDIAQFGELPGRTAGSIGEHISKNPLNVSGELDPAKGQFESGSQTFGPSGAVSDHLGSKEILASNSNNGTIGDGTASQGNNIDQITGLKAQQLTLPGVKPPTAPTAAVQSNSLTTNAVAPKSISTNSIGTKPAHIADKIPSKAAHTVEKFHQVSKSQSHEIAHKEIHKIPERKIASVQPHAKPHAVTTSKIAAPKLNTPKMDAPKIATPKIESGNPSSYTIRAGDNLWDIAKNHMGSGLHWHEIYNLNKDILGSNPDLIHTGTTIHLPGTDIASSTAHSGTYTVQHGDNLWNIAKDHLGGGQHWGEIYKANTNIIGDNPRLILPGQELHLGGHNPAIASTTGIENTPITHAPTSAPASHVVPSAAHGATMDATQAHHPIPHSSAPIAQPVLPSHQPTAAGPGAAQSATLDFGRQSNSLPHSLPNSLITKSPVSASLKPDLSFLYQKPSTLK